jgi:hypothetical protein
MLYDPAMPRKTEHLTDSMIVEYRAFIERITWYSLGIVHLRGNVNYEERMMGDAIGSGTACSWKGHKLILTAAHVVGNAEPERLAFLLRVDDAINWEGMGKPERVVQRVSLPIEKIVRCKEHDLAAIVLRADQLAGDRIQFCELPKQLRRSRTLRTKGKLILHGFPYDRVFSVSERRAANASVNYLAAKPTILHAPVAGPPSKPLASRYNPHRDVLVKYEPPEANMRPEGFSGAAAWCKRRVHSGTVWTANPMLFGVQTDAFMTSKLLLIVGAPTIREFLEQAF